MRLSSSINSLLLCLTAQLILFGAFASASLLEGSTQTLLATLDIDASVLGGIQGAFSRYLVWLIVALFIGTLYTCFDIRNSELDKKKNIALYGGLALFLFYLVLTRALQFSWNQDDSYIDFRYVINWVNNVSFDYNPGERAMGFTSHLHLAVLYLFALTFKSDLLPVISQNINIALQILTYFLSFHLVRSVLNSPFAGLLGAALLALSPYNIQETIGGKESVLAIFLITIALIAIQYKRPHIVAWSSALIVLTRPEGGLWMLLSMLWFYKEYNWKKWTAWIGPLSLLALTAAWLLEAFGTIIPHGLVGKSTMFYKPPFMGDLVLVLRRLADGCFLPEFLFPIGRPLSDIGDFFRLYGGTLVLFAMLKFLVPLKGGFRFYAISTALFWVLFSLTNPYLFPWYFAWFGLVPTILIPVLMLKLYEMVKENPGLNKNAIFASMLAFYLLSIQMVQQPFRQIAGLPAVTFFWSGACKRLVIYQKASEIARSKDPSQSSCLSAPEIGVLGYFYKGPILDLGGLVSNEILKYGPPSKELRVGTTLFSIIPLSIEELKPRFIVTDGVFCKKGVNQSETFKKEYRLVKFFPHKLWSDGIYMYELKKAAGESAKDDDK